MLVRDFITKQVEDARHGGLRRVREKFRGLLSRRGGLGEVRRLDIDPAIHEAARLLDRRSRPDAPPLHVICDNATTPPAFGDFMFVVMLARYLALAHGPTRFTIRDAGRRRNGWAHLTPREQSQFLSDQFKLARDLLPESVPCELTDAPVPCLLQDRDSDVVLADEVAAGGEIWPLAYVLLPLLAEGHQEHLPPGFLLSMQEYESKVDEVSSRHPYVAWAVRRAGGNAPRRNPTSQHVLRDFMAIRTRHPDATVMAFSTRDGVDFALEELSSAGGAARDAVESGLVVGQPDDGFPNAIPWILGCQTYYQRMGGGIGVVPIFSSIPYRIVSEDCGFCAGYQRPRIVPWARSDQLFLSRPIGAKYRRLL